MQYETKYVSAGLELQMEWDRFKVDDSAVSGIAKEGPTHISYPLAPKIEVQVKAGRTELLPPVGAVIVGEAFSGTRMTGLDL